MVEARGLHSYKDSILGIGIKGRKEFREAAVIHGSGKGKELSSRSIWIREAGNKLLIGLYGLGKMKFSCLAPILLLIVYSILVSIKIT